jgi:uncharacterized membrane protein YhaH (DUF805 family)
MEWYLMVWKKFAVFSGRSRRKEFWMFALINTLIGLVLSIVGNVLKEGSATTALFFFRLPLIYSVAVIIPYYAVQVRRLHDTGRSGWWILSYLAPCAVLGIVLLGIIGSSAGESSYMFESHLVELAVLIVSVLVGFVICIVFMAQDSVPGTNKYGPNPKSV